MDACAKSSAPMQLTLNQPMQRAAAVGCAVAVQRAPHSHQWQWQIRSQKCRSFEARGVMEPTTQNSQLSQLRCVADRDERIEKKGRSSFACESPAQPAHCGTHIQLRTPCTCNSYNRKSRTCRHAQTTAYTRGSRRNRGRVLRLMRMKTLMPYAHRPATKPSREQMR